MSREKLSYRGWQKCYGRSVGLHAPEMFIEGLRCTVAKTGSIRWEFATHSTKLSQYCHKCQLYQKKQLLQQWHRCNCGPGPVQRDLYSALLAVYLEAETISPSIKHIWEGAEARLSAAIERCKYRADFARCIGIPSDKVHLHKSIVSVHLELVFRQGRLEATG